MAPNGFLSNNAGGVLGGISTGQPVTARVAFKPTSSILTLRQTITRDGEETDLRTKGRHDPCVALRAVPVVEAMALGVPVACSDVTSLPEVAGDAAILFDPRKPEAIAAAIVALVQDEARRKLEGLRERIVNGADFGDLARQYSDDGTSSRGGDLGWLYPGDTVPDFERAMIALEPGQLSQPVRSPW